MPRRVGLREAVLVMSPNYTYPTPRDGVPSEVVIDVPSEAVIEFDDVDTALVATNPDHRGPMASELFEDIDTDKIEAFPEAAKMIAAAELAAKWEVIGACHDAMTEAGVSLAQASAIMAAVVLQVGLVPHEGPTHRGPNGTMRPHGDAPHGATGAAWTRGDK